MRRFLLILLILLVATVGLTAQETVVGRVGDETITEEEFQTRAEYERFYYFFFLETLVADLGEQALELDNPNNQVAGFVQSLVDALVIEEEFAEPLYQTMILESLYHQEAQARGLTADECAVDEQWLRLLDPSVAAPDCEQLPEDFEARRSQFIADVEEFTDYTQEDLGLIVTSRAEFDLVLSALREEAPIEDVPNVRTRHIRVADEETANEVIERLQDGEAFLDLLAEYTLDDNPLGNGGDLGTFARGQSGQPPALEEALFAAEEPGVLPEPVETTSGFHVAEVVAQEFTETSRVRHILLESEEDANEALRLLQDDPERFPDLAQRFSIDTGSARNGGDLGFGPAERYVEPFAEAVRNAETGEIVGPVETEFGFHVIQVQERREEVSAITARHILVGTAEEAQNVLERLEAGEDFADIATEVSVDPAAQGHRGDTRRLLLGGSEAGFYSANDVFPDFAEAVFDAEAGDVVGPVASFGEDYYVVVVDEFADLPPAPMVEQSIRNEYVVNWQEEQLASDRVEETDLWRGNMPTELQPSDVSETLAPLDDLLVEARESYEAFLEETNIINTLRGLEVPDTGQE